jgi:hypothetical protein
LRDFLDGGATCCEFQDVGLAWGERALSGADGVGGEFGVDVAAAAVDGAHHVGQYLCRDGLRQESAHSGGECPLEVSGPPVAGEDKAGAPWQLGDQGLGDGDPVEAGICRSRTATSGRCRRAIASASSPEAAWATTSMSSWVASREASAERIRFSSSASSTRITA